MSYYEQSIHHLEKLPSGAWRVVLEPRHVDPDGVFGAQLLIDTFTPDTNRLANNRRIAAILMV
jgi:hypothetical protein